MPKDEDFEVEEYVNIEIGEIERRTIKWKLMILKWT
jgi:hypothetical protein